MSLKEELITDAAQVGAALFKELLHSAHESSLTKEQIERVRRVTEDIAAARVEKAAADAIMKAGHR